MENIRIAYCKDSQPNLLPFLPINNFQQEACNDAFENIFDVEHINVQEENAFNTEAKGLHVQISSLCEEQVISLLM